jgi:WS/DGAT/MGAT family acyltransferase
MEATRVTTFDASFLALDGPVGVGHVTMLVTLDRDVTLSELRRQVQSRLHLAPILRRRLIRSPVRVGRPWWVDDAAFDLDRHLQVSDLGGDGTDQELAEETVRIASRYLRRDRPLWELHLVRGLSRRRSALVSKIHHCAADGMGGRELFELLFTTDSPTEPGSWTPDPGPDVETMVRNGIREATDFVAAAMLAREGLARTANGLGWLLDRRAGKAHLGEHGRPVGPPPTPFNAALTFARGFSFVAVDAAASRELRRTTGSTLNDILLATVAGALREWLNAHRALPGDPLVALVPVALREEEQDPGAGNNITLTLCQIPTHLPTASQRLTAVHETMTKAKAAPTVPRSTLVDIATVTGLTMAPMAVRAAATLHLADRVRLPFNLMVSNVPAPPRTLQVGAGARVHGTYPFPPLSDGMGLGINVQGYAGRLCIGVTACPDLFPDPWRLAALLRQAHEDLIIEAAVL